MNTELELRYILKDKTGFESRLRDIGAELTALSKVKDSYYTRSDISSLEEQNKWYLGGEGFVVRIRETKNEYTGNIQVVVEAKKTDKNNPHNINYENVLNFSSAEDISEFLNMIGLRMFTQVSKKRLIYKFENYVISVDDVMEYGVGVEVELIGSSEKTLSDLKEFCKDNLLLEDSNISEKGVSYLAFEALANF